MSQLSAAAIAAALTTRRLGHPSLYFSQVGSTNDMAHEQAVAGAADGLLIVADEQTAGRGRLNRSWWAPPGACLLLSLVLRPALPLTQAGQLTMCLGLGAAEGIERHTGLQAVLKWPNDLQLNGRKLGGMLTQLGATGDRLDYAVLGLGINVNVMFDVALHPPSDLIHTATSLQMALGQSVDRLALLVAILTATEAWYDRILRGETLHEAWAARLDTLGRWITVTSPTNVLSGMATGVTSEGGLVLHDASGREHVVWGGDITTARPI